MTLFSLALNVRRFEEKEIAMFLATLASARVHSASPRIALAASCLLTAVIVAEFAGYWLHRLLHSHRITWLSRSHLIHHFETYPPNGALRSPEYADATEGRFSLGNIGLEWIAPSALILFVCFLAVHAMRLPPWSQILFLSTLLVWPLFMFSYLQTACICWNSGWPILRS